MGKHLNMNLPRVNGNTTYIHKVGYNTKADKIEEGGLDFKTAVKIAESGGWGLRLPPEAPKRAICKCGRVYARTKWRDKCFDCTIYESDESRCRFCKSPLDVQYGKQKRIPTHCGSERCADLHKKNLIHLSNQRAYKKRVERMKK